jgi:hypothetical protein
MPRLVVMSDPSFDFDRSQQWRAFASDQATKLMIVVEPVYYGLTDQRDVGSPEENNQDRMDREHEAMSTIVSKAIHQFAREQSLPEKAVTSRKYVPPMPPRGGAVSFFWDIYQIAEAINWESELLRTAVLNSLWAVPSFIYRTLHERWSARDTPHSERNVPAVSHAMVVGMCFYHASMVHKKMRPKPPDFPDPNDGSPELPIARPVSYTVEIATEKGMLFYRATNRMELISLSHKRYWWSRATDLETASWRGLLLTGC